MKSTFALLRVNPAKLIAVLAAVCLSMLASDLLRMSLTAEFPGSGVTIFEKPKAEGKQQTAHVAVMAARRRVWFYSIEGKE